MSPNKVRRIADLVRGLPVAEADMRLAQLPHMASQVVAKTLKSAAANAENSGLSREELYISQIFVDEGPRLRRFLPRARGRADLIRKRTSHLTVVVEAREGTRSPARTRATRRRN